ncbi:MAG: dihydroorotase, partial [Deltaproteobacteria bacterium]|nr:dihydroorotase [Deltaproteobacteria bacterium]
MKPMRIVSGRVLDPSRDLDGSYDVRIENGLIAAVEPPGALPEPVSGEQVVDAAGLWIMPGLVDMHVHLREPGEEYKEDLESGLTAAVRGGFTAVCPMPNTSPVNDTRAVTEMIIQKAERLGLARLHPVAAVTRGLAGNDLVEMGDLADAGAVAFSDDGHCVCNANVMRRALEYARNFDAVVIQHAQDPDLTTRGLTHEGPVGTRLGMGGWPSAAEEVIVARDIVLTRLTGGAYHVAHVSTAGTVELIRRARDEGLRVTAEVAPHHLLLTDEATAGYDTNTKVNPPLRPERDRQALVEALAGGLIDVVASDHAPHSLLEKEGDFHSASFGISGLETSVGLVLGLVAEGALTPLAMARAMSTAPARILDLESGTLAVGARADITLVDPE